MEIVKLPVGVSATVEDDCVRIQQCADGSFLLTGSLLVEGEDGVTESLALIASEPYDNYDGAEAAGLAWANECGVSLVYVSQSDGAAPLPDPR